jgi:hypothetical protein
VSVGYWNTAGLDAAVRAEEITVGIVQLNTDDGFGELKIVADEPAIAAALRVSLAATANPRS